MHTQQAVRNSLLAAKLAEDPNEVLRKQNELNEYHRENSVVRDSANYTGVLKAYVEFSLYPREIVYGKYESLTRAILSVVIFLSCITVGMETYEYFSDNIIIEGIDIFVYAIFCIEFSLKLIAEGAGPHRYFTGPNRFWNIFDLILIFLTVPTKGGLFGSKVTRIGAISRICRLFRMLDVIRHIPALQVILNGLHHGITSIFYIIILLVLVCYMYSVLGVFLFRESDPFNFGYVSRAMLALFRYCTVENWSAALYVTYYGCARYDSGIYSVRSNYNATEWAEVPLMYRCTHPTSFYVFAYVYWLSFITVSFLIILSLFIGVVTLSMQTSLLEMKLESDEKAKKLRIAQAEKDFKAFYRQSIKAEAEPDSTGGRFSVKAFMQRQSDKFRKVPVGSSDGNDISVSSRRSMSHQERVKQNDMEHMRKLLMTAWAGTVQSKQYNQELEDTHFDSVEHFSRWLGPKCRKILGYNWFNLFTSVIIIFAGILIGIDADLGDSASSREAIFLKAMEVVVLIIFSMELFIRLAADEFHFREFIKSKWNIFDFFVVVGSLIPQGGALVLLLRLFRLIRVLKLVRAFPRLVVIVNALIQGLSSIAYIGSFILLQFYLFAITGTIIFGVNDPFSFGSLHLSFLTLCKIATLDAWGDIMYKNIYGCDVYPNPEFASSLDVQYCNHPEALPITSVFYFLSFVLTGSLVMLTLFVGVVTTSMEEATKAQVEEQLIEQEVRELCDSRKIDYEQLDIYKTVFALLDTDNGKVIEIDELRRGLEAIDLRPTMEELMTMLKDIDTNIDGVIDIVEFVAFMERMKVLHQEVDDVEEHKPSKATSIVGRGLSMLESIGEEVEEFLSQANESGKGNVKASRSSSIGIKPSRSESIGKKKSGSIGGRNKNRVYVESFSNSFDKAPSPAIEDDVSVALKRVDDLFMMKSIDEEGEKECGTFGTVPNVAALNSEITGDSRGESQNTDGHGTDAQSILKVQLSQWIEQIDTDFDTVMSEMAKLSVNRKTESRKQPKSSPGPILVEPNRSSPVFAFEATDNSTSATPIEPFLLRNNSQVRLPPLEDTPMLEEIHSFH